MKHMPRFKLDDIIKVHTVTLFVLLDILGFASYMVGFVADEIWFIDFSSSKSFIHEYSVQIENIIQLL